LWGDLAGHKATNRAGPRSPRTKTNGGDEEKKMLLLGLLDWINPSLFTKHVNLPPHTCNPAEKKILTALLYIG
jgi:hypothetical protein